MKNFEISLKWFKECEGYVTVSAESEEEAIAKLKKDVKLYTKLAENLYRGYRDSVTLGEVTITGDEAHVLEEVEYSSVWDGGYTITTKATYNVNTGEVFDIEPSTDEDAESVTTLDYEYITRPNGLFSSVFNVNEDGVYVTAEYIKNALFEAVAVHGRENIYLSYEGDDNCCITYGSLHDAFIYDDKVYYFKDDKAWDALKELCEYYDLPVEEC